MSGAAYGQTAADIRGKTLQANYTVHSETCTGPSYCKAAPPKFHSDNVYFSTNGNVFDYAAENRGTVFTLNKMMKIGDGISKGYLARGDVIEYRGSDNDLVLSVQYRIQGERCAVTRRITTGGHLQVNTRVALDFCRLVAGRVER
jgi:hypothetical protein